LARFLPFVLNGLSGCFGLPPVSFHLLEAIGRVSLGVQIEIRIFFRGFPYPSSCVLYTALPPQNPRRPLTFGICLPALPPPPTSPSNNRVLHRLSVVGKPPRGPRFFYLGFNTGTSPTTTQLPASEPWASGVFSEAFLSSRPQLFTPGAPPVAPDESPPRFPKLSFRIRLPPWSNM